MYYIIVIKKSIADQTILYFGSKHSKIDGLVMLSQTSTCHIAGKDIVHTIILFAYIYLLAYIKAIVNRHWLNTE